MVRMEAHAKAMGCEIIGDIVTKLEVDRRPFLAICDSGKQYTADAVILATGARAKWLGLTSEEKYKGFGVSACATCDGFFYRGQEIAVIGDFLPKQLSEDETKKICVDTIKSVGAASMKDMGKVMGALKSKHADSLDFSKVSKILKGLLS